MTDIKILNENDIKQILTLPMAIHAVEQAYLQKHAGSGEAWPMVFHEFDPGHADLDIKSGNLNPNEIFGLKVVSWFAENPRKQLPALFGTSLIFDLNTGKPKAILNAGPITDFRTGAAGAIGAKYLARPDSRNLLMVGCGTLAPYLIASTLLTMPQLEQAVIVNPRMPDHASERLENITGKVDSLLNRVGIQRSCKILSAIDTKAAVKKSDIILTATPSRAPLILADWIQPGTHLSCIGSDMSGKQEIESTAFSHARVFCDDTSQCLSVGECELPYKEGIFSAPTGEIGAVIAGSLPGRTSPEDITIFDSTGLALQDLASAAAILEQAEKDHLGITAAL